MKKLLFATAAMMVVASPAMARDGAGYIGIEGGLMKAQHSDWDRLSSGGTYVDFLDVKHKLGYDIDAIAGYDFGMFRLEAEIARKHAKDKNYTIDPNAPGPFPGGVGRGGLYNGFGRANATSLMVNALIDLGADDGVSFYAGGGVGYARVSQTVQSLGTQKYHLRDNDLAWQGIVGVRTAISPNIDAGLKYRYFSAGTLKGDLYGAGLPTYTGARSFFHSHSLLASLIFNFAPPAPPPPPPVVEAAPPPPPPPPATQTCPDGSVILATDACPAPPPPPPPPPPPAKGERG